MLLTHRYSKPVRLCRTGHLLTYVGLHDETYQSLKSQVKRLKCEQEQVLGARRTAKQVHNNRLHARALSAHSPRLHCWVFCIHRRLSKALEACLKYVHMQLENLAHLQQKDEAQQQQEAYAGKITKLQASLQEATDRSGKIRQQYER